MFRKRFQRRPRASFARNTWKRAQKLDWINSFDTECQKLEFPMDPDECPTKTVWNVLANSQLVTGFSGKATIKRVIGDFFFFIPPQFTCGPPALAEFYSWVARAGTRVYDLNQTTIDMWAAPNIAEGMHHKIYTFGSMPTQGLDSHVCSGPGTVESLIRDNTVSNWHHWHFDQKKSIPLRADQECRLDIQFRPFLTNGPFDPSTPNMVIQAWIKTLVAS